MGRGYRTSKPTYKQDASFQTPFNLAAGAIQAVDKRVDKGIGETDLLGSEIDRVKFLEMDRETVKGFRQEYNDEIDSIQEAMRADPLGYQKYNDRIRKLTRKIKTDRTTGDYGAVENRFADVQSFMKENKGKQEFDRGLDFYMSNMKSKLETDPNARLQANALVDRPDIVNKYQSVLKDVKSDIEEVSNGQFRYKGEIIEQDDVEGIVMGLLSEDPEYKAYMRQQGRFGDIGYVDQQGNPNSLYALVGPNGENLSREQFLALAPEQQQGFKVGLNSANPFSKEIEALGETYDTRKLTMDENQAFLNSQKHAMSMQMLAGKHGYNIAMQDDKFDRLGDLERLKHMNRLEAIAAKGGKGSGKAKIELDLLKAKSSLGKIKNIPQSFSNDIKYLSNPTSVETSRVKNANDYVIKNDYTVELTEGVKGSIKEYNAFLNNRQPSEKLAIEYMVLLHPNATEEEKKELLEGRPITTSVDPLMGSYNQSDKFTRKRYQMISKIEGLGDDIVKFRDKQYENYNNENTQPTYSPIKDSNITAQLSSMFTTMPGMYRVHGPDGESLGDDAKDFLKDLEGDEFIGVTAGTSTGKTHFKVVKGNKIYYILPRDSNPEHMELSTRLAREGVDKDAQYLMDTRNPEVNRLITKFGKAGLTPEGKKKIRDNYGEDNVSLELMPNGNVVLEYEGETLPPFKNMRHYVETKRKALETKK